MSPPQVEKMVAYRNLTQSAQDKVDGDLTTWKYAQLRDAINNSTGEPIFRVRLFSR